MLTYYQLRVPIGTLEGEVLYQLGPEYATLEEAKRIAKLLPVEVHIYKREINEVRVE